jgi:peptidyl-prolyl cis-trans isomerase C
MPIQRGLIFITICLLSLSLTACNPAGEKPAASKSDTQVAAAPQSLPAQQPQPSSPPSTAAAIPANLVVDVDGHKMTKEQLNAELEKRMLVVKDQIPQERLQEVKANAKKRLIDDFVVRSLLQDEINRQKITATDQDVREAVDS